MKRILYIESDKELRFFFSSKLKDEFRGVVNIASTVKQAKKLLIEEEPYNVIVLDYCLADGSGIDILKFKIRHRIEGRIFFFTNQMELRVPFSDQQCAVFHRLEFDKMIQGIRQY